MLDSTSFAPRKRVEVDVSAIRANTSALVEHVGGGVQVMAMVKSNGYGHGLRVAAEAAIDGGATWLGVASSAEAFEVSTFRVPVLIVGRCDPGSHEALIDQGIETTVYDEEAVDTTAGAAALVGRRARVHVKVDTGMGRLGVSPDGLAEFLRMLVKYSADVEIAGVFTNFADSDARDLGFTDQQHECFVAAVDEVRAVAPDALAHCSNSGAILRAPRMHHDLVRPGIALYGYVPDVPDTELLDFRLAMTMLAPVTQVKTVPAGTTVGYGRTWTAPGPTRVATVAAGYADGVLRAQSNRGVVLVSGWRCPIVGRVSMDQLCVDVSGVDAEVRPGDDVVLFGEQSGVRLGADEVAGYAGTIEREILTAVADRIPRVVVSR